MLDTGRMTNTVYHYVSQIEKRVAFIAYNGAALTYDGWGILRLIQPEQIRKVAAFCHKHGLYMQTYGQMRIYAEKYCKELLIDPDLKHSEFVKVDDFEKYDGLPTPKILCVRSKMTLINCWRRWQGSSMTSSSRNQIQNLSK